MKLWEPKRKRPKAVPTHLQNRVVWSWTLTSRVVWSQMLSQWVSIPTSPRTWSKRIKQRLWALTVPRSSKSCVRPTLQEVVFENSPRDHETRSTRCHVGIHVEFTSIVHSRMVPQAQCEANWTSSASSTNERAWSQWSWALSLVCEVALDQSQSWHEHPDNIGASGIYAIKTAATSDTSDYWGRGCLNQHFKLLHIHIHISLFSLNWIFDEYSKSKPLAFLNQSIGPVYDNLA